ncbi:MBL fold metallo-hydrolase [Natrialbaceae archaeon A-CW2]
MIETITIDRFSELLDGDTAFALLDTRPPESYEAWHAPGAKNVPFEPTEDVSDRLEEIREVVGDHERVLTICGKGVSSGTLAAKLARATDAYDVVAVEGGMNAWSRVYHRAPVDVPGATIVQLQRRSKGCLSYLVGDPETGSALAVDPTADLEAVFAAAGEYGLRIEGVLDTHVHADHVSGGRDLATRLEVPYYLPERAASRGVEHAFEPLEDGQTLAIGGLEFRVLHTPGHTSDGISLLVDDRAVLTADTLHAEAVGRTELEFGDEDAERGARLLYDSLHGTLLELPDDVVVLPGHVGVSTDGRFQTGIPREAISTTVGTARTAIEALSLAEDAFVDRLAAAGDKPENYETIIAINRGARALDPDERVELEIGPNNCSA